jgi:hypothetical protein
MENYQSIDGYCKDLKLNYPKLSEYECLSIAVQMQRNDILIAGLAVPGMDTYPPALEAIAIQLGMSQTPMRNNDPYTLLYALKEISEKMDDLK